VNNGAILEMSGICKAFPGVRALKDVDFDLMPGEVHALIGENGAGKSTLIKILTGVYTKDAGEIKVGGRRAEFNSPRDAEDMGISAIYQKPNLVLEFNGVENIFLGDEIRGRFGIPDWKKMAEKAHSLLQDLGIQISLYVPIHQLSPSERQIIAIAKALSQNASILIMDEVTAPLSSKEIDSLFALVRELKKKGCSIIYISHRLEEVKEIADRNTVLRNGKKVGTLEAKDLDVETLIRMMIGEEMEEKFFKEKVPLGKPILAVKGLSGGMVKNVSFEVRQGEILSFTGLIGAGKTELAQIVFGIDPKEKGQIYLDGREIEINSPRDASVHGIYLAPEDRMTQGLVLDMELKENVTLNDRDKVANRFGLINTRLEEAVAREFVRNLSIATPSIRQKVKFLSGGNQQKVVLSKGMFAESKIYIFDEPTTGIDIRAKKEFYVLMADLVKKDAGIIFISTEIPEVLALSDRILVMRKGEIHKEFTREEATMEKILLSSFGIKGEE
jgi:ribose transport system ATP-binding protein